MSDLRLKVIKALGGKCKQCGWGKDPRVLRIWSPTKPNPKGTMVVGWWEGIVDDPDPEVYSLLCANCHFLKMYDKHKAKPKAVDVFVWKTDMTKGDLMGLRIPWLERKIAEEGLAVMVEFPDGERVEYVSGGIKK